MPDRLCLLCVHAHPDDEASKGAPTVARYHAEGVRTVLVCCTGGEEGDILNPAMDTPEVRADIGRIRMAELKAATDIIGYDETVLLGLPGLGHARLGGQRPARTASPRRRSTRRWAAWWPSSAASGPQVIVTYGDDQSEYPHPDHLRVHEISVLAFDAAGDPDRFPEAGPPFAPAKLYYSVWSGERFRQIHAKFEELGLESPFDDKWLARMTRDRALHHDHRRHAASPTSAARRSRRTPPRSTPTRRSGSASRPRCMRDIHPGRRVPAGRRAASARPT